LSRLVYGADTQSPTLAIGRIVGDATITFWTTAGISGSTPTGTPVTDLLDAGSNPITQVVSHSDGSLPQFSGPVSGQGSSSAPGMWAYAGGAELVWYDVQNKSTGVAVGALLATNDLSDVADTGSSRFNLHVTGLTAKVVATSNQASLSGLPTVDGYTLLNNDTVLLVGQSTASQNGLWRTAASGAGAWVRPTDFPHAGVVTESRICQVGGWGTGLPGSQWVLVPSGSVTVDTTAQTWQSTQFVTQTGTDNSNNPATTAFVQAAITAALASLAQPLKFASAGLSSAKASRYESFAGNITVGACLLQGSPVTNDLVVVLQKSTDGGATWQTVQSLTITAGTTTPASANPAAAITGPSLIRVNVTSIGGGTDFAFEAQVTP
jgi:hypothetical protein